MKIEMLLGTPSPDLLAVRLEEFESAFTYPLGSGGSFCISHSPDYTRFFRSMGTAACFVALRGDRVIGTLSVAIRDLTIPDGSVQKTAYIGDLKVAAEARSSRALVRLAQAADEWARPQVTAAYGVVMAGTGTLPADYSGRAGIEFFQIVGRVILLRLPTAAMPSAAATPASPLLSTEGRGRRRRLCYHGKFSAEGGVPATRSEIEPTWLVLPDGTARGRLEDTRKAKRLIGSDGIEMLSAHLSGFVYQTPGAGVELLRGACAAAKSHGLPALFVSIPESQFPALDAALGPIEKVTAPATIYGAGLEPGADWIINTSEI